MEMVDFLLCSDPFNFETVLLSYADENTRCTLSDFRPYLTNVSNLFNVLSYARDIVKRRMNFRGCDCTDSEKRSFRHVLIDNFSNRTIFHYLLFGDCFELDGFMVHVADHYTGFIPREVFTAYHNVRKLKDELTNVKEKLMPCDFY